ncbi:MAG: hypothetical protein ACR2MB_14550, partial [Acidimicrobiales bacterium]
MTVESIGTSRVVVSFDRVLESIPSGSGEIATYPHEHDVRLAPWARTWTLPVTETVPTATWRS